MSANDFEQPVAASGHGKRVREAFFAKLQASSDAMQAASIEAHRADHNVVTAGQAGIFGTASGYDMAAEIAALPVRVGQDYGGQGRPLETLGGTFDPADVGCAPAPARADLRHVGMPPGHQIGESPLAAFMRTREQ